MRLPKYWWHFVEQRDAGCENVSLSFWLGSKGNDDFMREVRGATLAPDVCTREQADSRRADRELESLLAVDGGSALRAFKLGRLVEEMSSRACGRGGGEFLSDLAAGDDLQWDPDSKAVVLARRVRATICSILGASHVDAFLRMVTRDGRLHPGPPPIDRESVISSERGGRGLWGMPGVVT